MKIHAVETNNHRKAFAVTVGTASYWYPYARVAPAPCPDDAIAAVVVDPELGREAFTYTLASGAEGSVHVEQVLDYNRDPGYLRDLLLYELTLEAQRRVAESPLSKRELIRRMSTSPRQFYRLLDQTCMGKSIDQVVKLLAVLECRIQMRVRSRASRPTAQRQRIRAGRPPRRASRHHG